MEVMPGFSGFPPAPRKISAREIALRGWRWSVSSKTKDHWGERSSITPSRSGFCTKSAHPKTKVSEGGRVLVWRRPLSQGSLHRPSVSRQRPLSVRDHCPVSLGRRGGGQTKKPQGAEKSLASSWKIFW